MTAIPIELKPGLLPGVGSVEDAECQRWLALSIRCLLEEPARALWARMTACSAELDSVAHELERDDVELDPAAAVACVRLLGDGPDSPLFNPALPAADALSCLSLIGAGLHPRPAGNP